MEIDEALALIEQALDSRLLTTVERFIIQKSWQGQTYDQIAEDCGYGNVYIKQVGSELWQQLSDAIGQRISKKNLAIALKTYQDRKSSRHLDNALQGEPQDDARGNAQNSRSQAERERTGDRALPQANRYRPDLIDFSGRPIALHSPLYIERPPIEALAYAEITAPGSLTRILAPRQMGKTSLLNRMIAHAQTQGYATVRLDLRETDKAIFNSLDLFLRWLCVNVSHQLQLSPNLEPYWDEIMGSKVSCKLYFENYLLKKLKTPLLLAIDELNHVFEHPTLALDFLPMLRVWHEQAKQVEIWQNLRIVLVHTTENYVPLHLSQSPFNVGRSLRLPVFTVAQIQILMQRYGLNGEDESTATALHNMLGGHPYLINMALYALLQPDSDLITLLQSASSQTGIYSQHLQTLLALLRDEADLVIAFREVLKAKAGVQLNAIAAHKLESLGLIQRQGNRATVSCALYRRYFEAQLCEIQAG